MVRLQHFIIPGNGTQPHFGSSGMLSVRWQGTTLSHPVPKKGRSAVFDLAAGANSIDIWFTQTGQKRAALPLRSLEGDVEIERLDSSK